jgi:hypothetical protein
VGTILPDAGTILPDVSTNSPYSSTNILDVGRISPYLSIILPNSLNCEK